MTLVAELGKAETPPRASLAANRGPLGRETTMRASVAAVTLLALAASVACAPSARDESADPSQTASSASGRRAKLAWETSWDSAFRRARSENRVVMVEFYADWCVWCKRMDSSTFTHAEVVGLLGASAVPLRIDGEREGKMLAAKFRVDGYPTIVFLSPDERELGRVPGYLDGPEFAQTVRPWLSQPS